MIVLHLVKTSVGAMWAYRLMRELVQCGVEVHVALPYSGPNIELYREAGVITHELDYALSGSCLRNLRKIVDEVKPDLIHSHFVLTTLVMRMALRKYAIPRVFEVPGPLHLEKFLFRTLDVRTAQKNDYWIPTCRWSYERYRRSGVAPDRLFLTYYGSDIQHGRYEKGKLRKELGLRDTDILVGMVAFMYPPKYFLGQRRGLKGHEDFIDAMRILTDKYPNVYGVCIGGAWNNAASYEKKIRDYGAKHCKRVFFLGSRSNVGELYQDINCAVHPSYSENLGGASESLLLGVPTIATRVGGFPDIVIPEKTGLLVPKKSPRILAEAIERFILDPEEAIRTARRGQALVSDLLDIKRTSKEMFEIYRKVVNPK